MAIREKYLCSGQPTKFTRPRRKIRFSFYIMLTTFINNVMSTKQVCNINIKIYRPVHKVNHHHASIIYLSLPSQSDWQELVFLCRVRTGGMDYDGPRYVREKCIVRCICKILINVSKL